MGWNGCNHYEKKTLGKSIGNLKSATIPTWLNIVAHDSMLRLSDLTLIFGISRTSFEGLISNGYFPYADSTGAKGQQIGHFFNSKARGWKASTVRSFIRSNAINL